MAQAMTSMTGLRGFSQAVLEGSLQLSGQTRLNIANNNRVTVARPGFTVRAQQAPTEPETGRRAVLVLLLLVWQQAYLFKLCLPMQKALRLAHLLHPLLDCAWPSVRNDLCLKAEYLRYDLNIVISTKSKDEKKSLKELTGKLFDTIGDLDHATKNKSTLEAEKYFALTVSTLNDVLAKLG
ncbi:hypothetical protein CRYUN_Cryun32bG0027200 [Craigia yunnanensis]